MNDPNGLSFVPDSPGSLVGTYHMFYQANPNSTRPAWSKNCTAAACGPYWGHATSRDLVHWLEPYGNATQILGSSGAAVVLSAPLQASSGYFAVAFTGGQKMWATTTRDMRDWFAVEQAEINDPCQLVPVGVLPECSGGDNYAWLGEDGKTVYALGGGMSKAKGPEAMVFKSTSHDLLKWEFDSVLYNGSAADSSIELNCPDLFPIAEGRFALIWLAHPPWHKPWITIWELGYIDPASKKFVTETRGLADQSSSFIAAQSFWVPPSSLAPIPVANPRGGSAASSQAGLASRRRVQFSWVDPGLTGNSEGAQTLPRTISLSTDGQALTFSPAAEVSLLQNSSSHRTYSGLVMGVPQTGSLVLKDTAGWHLQLNLVLHLGDAREHSVGAVFGTSVFGGLLEVRVEQVGAEWVLNVPNFTKVNQHSDLRVLPRQDGSVALSIFVDGSVVEVFLGDRRGDGASATTCSGLRPSTAHSEVQLFWQNTTGRTVTCDAETWEMLAATPWGKYP